MKKIITPQNEFRSKLKLGLSVKIKHLEEENALMACALKNHVVELTNGELRGLIMLFKHIHNLPRVSSTTVSINRFNVEIDELAQRAALNVRKIETLLNIYS